MTGGCLVLSGVALLLTMTVVNDQGTYDFILHYSDVVMGTMASQITNLPIVYSTIYSGTDERKHQSSTIYDIIKIGKKPIHLPPTPFRFSTSADFTATRGQRVKATTV